MTDPLLRRLERTAVAACLVMAGIAWLIAGWRAAAAVFGGGMLAAVSYSSLASGAAALVGAVERAVARPDGAEGAGPSSPNGEGVDAEHAARTPRPGVGLLAKVGLRYALLGILAYVMIARLRLHPVGVLAGVSSVVIAVSVEALRILVKKS